MKIGSLVLTRKIGEKIRIGEDIIITVNKFKENAVSLLIEAPVDIRVDREEVWNLRKDGHGKVVDTD